MKKLAILLALAGSANSFASEVPISGNVASKCKMVVETVGVYGNPSPNSLSTAPADGGVLPIIRYDVSAAEYYKAVITTPDDFSSSPSLDDTVTWTGSVEVSEVSDVLMASYETDKVEYGNTTSFDLDVAGSVWFKANSSAEYGYNKSFPAGNYSAVVVAECIAR